VVNLFSEKLNSMPPDARFKKKSSCVVSEAGGVLGCILWVFVMLSLGLKRRSTQSGAENVRVSVRGDV